MEIIRSLSRVLGLAGKSLAGGARESDEKGKISAPPRTPQEPELKPPRDSKGKFVSQAEKTKEERAPPVTSFDKERWK